MLQRASQTLKMGSNPILLIDGFPGASHHHGKGVMVWSVEDGWRFNHLKRFRGAWPPPSFARLAQR